MYYPNSATEYSQGSCYLLLEDFGGASRFLQQIVFQQIAFLDSRARWYFADGIGSILKDLNFCFFSSRSNQMDFNFSSNFEFKLEVPPELVSSKFITLSASTVIQV